MKSLFCLLAGLVAFSTVHAESPQASPSPLAEFRRISTSGPLTSFLRRSEAMPGYCCKVCSKGYACGDTCISRDKDCHVGPGCACDG